MFHRNEGPLDRALRLVVAIVLLPLGLFVLGGADGAIVGLDVAAPGVIRAGDRRARPTRCSFSTLREVRPAPSV